MFIKLMLLIIAGLVYAILKKLSDLEKLFKAALSQKAKEDKPSAQVEPDPPPNEDPGKPK